MNNTLKKLTSFLLSAAMILTACSLTGCAKKEADLPAPKLELPSALSPAAEGHTAADKDETVYVFTNADGTVGNTIVSNWLKNPHRAAALEDSTQLQNIENVSGTETFTSGSHGSLVWDSHGNDIYYQGTTHKDLPVTMKISYTLDGQPITADALAGRSGRVTIRFDYTNHETATADVGGNQETLFVPFVMVTGTILDPQVFRDVTVKNGKMENLGNGIAVIGLAFPGMQENLNLPRDKFDIPDFFEISADAENFKMGPAMTVASPSLLKALDADSLNSQTIQDQAKSLTDGMEQLLDGSERLCSGLNTLLEKAAVLDGGVGQLSSGGSDLQNGTDALCVGASDLQAGASRLSAGLTALNANSAALKDGALQVFRTLLASATSELNASGLSVPSLTIENYGEVLGSVIASLDETTVYQSALEQVTAGVELKRGEIKAAVTAAVRQQITAEVRSQVTAAVHESVAASVREKEDEFRSAVILQATGMTPEEYQNALEAGLVTDEQQQSIEAAVAEAMDREIEARMESEQVQARIEAAAEQTVAEKMETGEIRALIAKNTELQVQKAICDTMTSPEIQAKLQAAAEGSKSVIALKNSLDSYNSFYLGLLTYTSGVAAATAGASDLHAGADTLKNGLDTLSGGVGRLNSGIQSISASMPDLIAGVTALRDGSEALKAGLTMLMDDGIRKLSDLAQEDLADLTDRLAGCIEASGSYTSFSGKCEESMGTVRFIYKTASIGE